MTHRAASLIELLVGMSVLIILLMSGMNLTSLLRNALITAKTNNIALFASESLRNRVIGQMMLDFSYVPENVENAAASMQLPGEVNFECYRDKRLKGSPNILRMDLKIKTAKFLPVMKYSRRIPVP